MFKKPDLLYLEIKYLKDTMGTKMFYVVVLVFSTKYVQACLLHTVVSYSCAANREHRNRGNPIPVHKSVWKISKGISGSKLNI